MLEVKEQFEQDRLFRQLIQAEIIMIGLASKLGRGYELSGTEKRKYYRQVGLQKSLTVQIIEKGWLEQYKLIGLG